MYMIPKTTALIFTIIGVIVLAAIVGTIIIVILIRRKNFSNNMSKNHFNPSQPNNNRQNNMRYNIPSGNFVNSGYPPVNKTLNNINEFRLLDINSGKVFLKNVINQITIGRRSDCDIILNDPLVSGHHCSVTQRGGSFYVTDMGSTNGTIVNGIQISSETELKSGDLIMLGTKEYKVN